MFSYIFMKILENRPERYDKGINLLSLGHANKIKKRIVQEHVKPGMAMLDLGCGTGTLVVEAAKAGAAATGVDISTGMLAVAQKRITDSGMQDRITLHNAGVAEVGSLFEENSFDLIVSTLVFSELYKDERAFALHQIKKLLKPNGVLVVAVETRPRNPAKKFAHFFVRLPLAILTYLIAQTGTKAVAGMADEISASGLRVVGEKRSFLDSFTIVAAKKTTDDDPDEMALPKIKQPREDISPVKSLWDFIGRWFPNPVEPGLRAIGEPDRKSPVILTGNFHLSVRRVEKALKGENAYLLAAPSNGINVWCASCGGDLNTHSVITAIKTSRVNERVDHRQIILPQFSAPGIDRRLLKNETGRHGLFGPAYAKHLPAFFKSHKTVYEHNKADFSLAFRLEMLLAMNFIVWFAAAIATLLIKPGLFLPLSAFFWGTGFILYAGFPLIPGKSGWLKAAILSIIQVVAIALFSVFILNMPMLSFWKMMITVSAINLWLGFDLRGIVAGNPSEAEWLMHKLGMTSFGHLFSAGAYYPGKIQQDVDKCNDCRICLQVCPKGVFGIVDKNRIRIQRQWECFACRACVAQCEQEALSLN